MVPGIIKINVVGSMLILVISTMVLLAMPLGSQTPYCYAEQAGLKVVQGLAGLNMATGMALVHTGMIRTINTG